MPSPSAERSSISPPSSSIRSRMPSRPRPSPVEPGSKPSPSSLTVIWTWRSTSLAETPALD
ncbi:MAG TPA: hypothetical protein VG816_03605, partial [Solirubrobacterales bacterium]|nr:hypothetical protein [Solirubrobacterales bacterium]